MKHRVAVVGLAAIIVPLLAGCGLQAVEEPTAPIEAIPLELEEVEVVDSEPVVVEEVAEVVEEPTPVPVEESIEEPTVEQVEEPTAEPIEEPTAEPVEEPTAEPIEEPTAEPVEEASGITIFQISQDDSEVRFELDEDLAGSRFTVVGVTNQVAGELALDYADLSSTQVGVIQINARTLATDSEFRNRSINNRILDTGTFEFITFTPTGVEGLPESINIGDSVSFSLVGTLTIRDITLDVTFGVEVTAVSDTQISGTASTIINREDFDLVIPSVPNVANVEEEIELYIDFTANAIQ